MDIEEKRQEISDMLNDLSDEQVRAMWAAMNIHGSQAAMNAHDGQRWVIRAENGAYKMGLKNLIGQPPHVFWNPTKGWVKTPSEARQYTTELGAKRAVSWFHGRAWQRDNVDVIRVTP